MCEKYDGNNSISTWWKKQGKESPKTENKREVRVHLVE